MPCHHKFQHQLQLTELDFIPETLIVGTFNPAWPESNTAEWFYGRTATSYFWDILPRLYGEQSLLGASPAEWKQFCSRHRIALTDLFSTVEDADESKAKHHHILGGYSDDAIIHNFDDIEFTDIAGLLRRHPSIKNVYITRSITEAFWKHLWGPVMHHANSAGLHQRQLLTPDASATYQHHAHNQQHPEAEITLLPDYLLMRWQQAWHQL